MGLLGRFFSPRDLKLITSINGELLGDVIQSTVTIFKICPEQTVANIYGESSQQNGKSFYPGCECTCHIDRPEMETTMDEFGPDRKQDLIFKFLEEDLKTINLYPEISDVIQYNNQYYTVGNVTQTQFLGNIPDKSLSIIVYANYSRLSGLSLVKRQI
jgi:hypothetical protein